MTFGNVTNVKDYYQLAAQEAALARTAVTNESRAQHYAMAACYTRSAEAKEKIAGMRKPAIRTAPGRPALDTQAPRR